MESAITAIIVIGILILAVAGLSSFALSSQAAISESNREMQARLGERTQTNLSPVSAVTTPAGDYAQITLKNSGNSKLMDFAQWDVILQYSDGTNTQIKWYAYGSGVNQWSQQIYQTTTPPTAEVFEPGILNPGEEIVITVNVSPPIGTGTTNLATMATPNGITASAVFTR
ncbi:MAG: hypothetical protein HY327_13305 [Chloroflexi bacterium]|nr:hypothetical protein [Chloroflexota bacterium]